MSSLGQGAQWQEQALAREDHCPCHQLEVTARTGKATADPGNIFDQLCIGMHEVFKDKQYGIFWKVGRPSMEINC